MSKKVRFLAVIVGVLLMIVAGRVTVNLSVGDLEIPITGQTFVVLLVGYYCRNIEIVLVYAVYLLAGAVGLPVFANGAAGFEHLIDKSGGYLYSFPLGALFVAKYKSVKGVGISLLAIFVLATAIILLVGMIHLSQYIGLADAFTYGVRPYIAGGVIKCVLAISVIYVVDRFYSWY